MLTWAQMLSDSMNEIGDQYIMEAMEYQCRKASRIRLGWVLIAAALLVGLLSSALAVRYFSLRDLVLPPVQSRQIDSVPDSGSAQTAPERVTLTLSGYMDMPESQAFAEWKAFLDGYDGDHAILDAVGNTIQEELRPYLRYNVYTQEMADELERIAAKYGLKLHTQTYDLFAHPELLDSCEGYLGENQGSALYMYEDGSFCVDGNAYAEGFGIVGYQLSRYVRGSLHEISLTLLNVDSYQEWEYQTVSGVPALLALGDGRALILTDLEDSFVSILCLAGENDGLTQEQLETLADSFDLSRLDPVVVPELADVPDASQPLNAAASERTTARATYAAVLRELLYSGVLPDGTPVGTEGWDMSENRFAVLDVDGDGAEELILLYMTTITAGRRGMVIAFDGTYTGNGTPISIRLDCSPDLDFLSSGYIKMAESHNQTLSEFWPYVLFDMNGNLVAIVSAQDRAVMEAAGVGEDYPEGYDVCGAGRVYTVLFTYMSRLGIGPCFWDETEYRAWYDEACGWQTVDIPYLALTEEHITSIETQ